MGRMHRMKSLLVGLVACVLAVGALAPSVSAQGRRDPATLTLAADLKASRDAGAAVIATLPAGTAVSVLDMRGRDARVDADGKVGWMASDKLRIGGPAAANSGSSGGSSWLRGITGLLGGGDSSSGGGSKVPIGVRGLKKDDLASARPDPAAVDRLEEYRASDSDGVAHARATGLQSHQVDYRQAQAAVTSSESPTSSGPDN